ncbi:MAG TPA: hypothetical protein PKE47_16280 [Verrucomicrobiota bacterium]|nr:hypothetical protein [Verrucomicrobiota bacterium]
MSITVLKERDAIRVLEVSGELPDGRPITFFSPPSDVPEDQALLDAQMPAFIRGDEDEPAEELFPVR